MSRQSFEPRPSIPEPRAVLLAEVLAFVRTASTCPGVLRIALIGSLATDKPVPKDADVLVTLEDDIELGPLARAARRLKGKAGSINLGADIFLCDRRGRYIGRICGYRECHPRVACQALNCGRRDHLSDDLDILTLSSDLTLAPPLVLWPRLERRAVVPDDVERLLLAPLTKDG